MEDPRQKLTRCVSTSELERRWSAVRQKMKERKIDYLVMQNSEEYMGGTLRWFTDFTARHQFPVTVIFPVDDEMTTIVCGLDPPGENWPPAWAARGIKNRLGAVYFLTLNYTNTYDAERAVSVLAEKKKPTIGWVEKGFIPVPFYEHVLKSLPDANFVDATDWIDELRVNKSPEEIEMIKGTAALQDACMEEMKNIIRPGMRDLDVYAEIHCFAAKQGSERGIVQVGSAPMGSIAPFDVPHFQNRVIKEGDQVSVLVEVNGPGGYYTEVLRVFALGAKPSQALQDGVGNAVEAQDLMARALVPGADPKALWATWQDFVKKKGYPLRSRSFAHGQGLSLLERPNIRPDESMTIGPAMNIVIHPSFVTKEAFAVCGDGYLTTNNGAERLHQYPRQITLL